LKVTEDKKWIKFFLRGPPDEKKYKLNNGGEEKTRASTFKKNLCILAERK